MVSIYYDGEVDLIVDMNGNGVLSISSDVESKHLGSFMDKGKLTELKNKLVNYLGDTDWEEVAKTYKENLIGRGQFYDGLEEENRLMRYALSEIVHKTNHVAYSEEDAGNTIYEACKLAKQTLGEIK